MKREDVIRQIVKRECQKQGLTEKTVLQEDKTLHGSACEHFGTWDTALQYAGVEANRLTAVRVYGRNEVIRQIHKLCVGGYSVEGPRVMQRDRRLYRAAIEHFGRWTDALEATGIDPANVCPTPKTRPPDKQKMIEDLRQRHESGLTLIWSEVCLENRVGAARIKHAFGSWGKALAAAGLSPALYRVNRSDRWTTQEVISAIQERVRQKKPLTCAAVLGEKPALVREARRHFGRWRSALEAARKAVEDRGNQDEQG